MLKVGRGPAGAVAAVMASLCEQPEAVNKWGRAEGGGGGVAWSGALGKGGGVHALEHEQNYFVIMVKSMLY